MNEHITPDGVTAGVVGVGSMGRHHARVYRELPGVELGGVVDTDRDRAREVAEEYGTTAVDRDELLDAVDVASVAVPTSHHYRVVRDCIDRGVDVLVEKPLVERPEQGRALVALAEEADVTLQVGHVERFNPAVRALGSILEDLDVIAIEADRLGPPPDREITDSAVVDLMIHDIDILLWLVDAEMTSVTAAGARDRRYATANIQFENGVVSQLTASRVTQKRTRTLTVTAATRVVVVDYTDQSIQIHRHSLPEYVEENGDVNYRHESIIEEPTVDTVEPLKEELASFVRAATTDQTPAVTGEEGLRVLETARFIERLITDDRTAARSQGGQLIEVDSL